MSDMELTLEDEPRQLNQSGSLCPAVKAADMIGDKWILLIMRELFVGASRYNEFKRALPRISPTVLSKRLKQMEETGLICLLYTSPSPRDQRGSRMPSSA